MGSVLQNCLMAAPQVDKPMSIGLQRARSPARMNTRKVRWIKSRGDTTRQRIKRQSCVDDTGSRTGTEHTGIHDAVIVLLGDYPITPLEARGSPMTSAPASGVTGTLALWRTAPKDGTSTRHENSLVTISLCCLLGFRKREYRLGKESMAWHSKRADELATGYPEFLAGNAEDRQRPRTRKRRERYPNPSTTGIRERVKETGMRGP